ncbi:MAG: hypothetical protein OXH01_09935, partial [Bacteroidetes bacterium]|nr:hypothetical protein [Bacteroidota bacterium]
SIILNLSPRLASSLEDRVIASGSSWADKYGKEKYWAVRVGRRDWELVERVEGVPPPPGAVSLEVADALRVAHTRGVGEGIFQGIVGAQTAEQMGKLTILHEFGHIWHITKAVELKWTYDAYQNMTGAPNWWDWSPQLYGFFKVQGYAGDTVEEATAEAWAFREIYGEDLLPAEARKWLEWLEVNGPQVQS